MATLTLTPDPNSSPPSVLVEAAATAGRVVSSVALTRDGVPVLGSALAGFGTATYTDYSAPYGQLCSYRAVVIESEQTWPALWSEAWASLASWTGASWSVAAGVASSEVYGATLTRAAANFGKITVADPHYVRLELLSAAGSVVGSVACTSSMVIAGTTTATIAAVDDFEAWIVGTVLYVATAAQSVSVAIAGNVSTVRLAAPSGGIAAGTWPTVNPIYGSMGDAVADPASSHVYVNTGQVSKFTTSGALVARWASGGGKVLRHLAIDAAGDVYTLAWTVGDSTVSRHSPTGALLATWTVAGEGRGIAINPDGDVIVVTDSRLRKYTPAGALLTDWYTGVLGLTHVAVDSAGTVYVTRSTSSVRKYSPDWTLITTWATTGAANIAVDIAGDVYVTDSTNRRLRKYTPAGVPIADWTTTGVPLGIAVDADGYAYVVDETSDLVRTYVQVASVGALVVWQALTEALTDFDLTADTTLEATTAWLIHPKTPALSVPLAIDGFTEPALNIEMGGIQSATREAQAGRQRAAGASEDAVFTVGNRSAPSLTVSGFTLTDACKASLVSLFTDEAPVMPRFPPAWEMPIDERWYSVGDYTEAFVAPSSRTRKWSLPLTPAAIPYVIVQPVWNWATVVLNYATWADVIAAYETTYDLIVNNPRA